MSEPTPKMTISLKFPDVVAWAPRSDIDAYELALLLIERWW
jgi:hypothetical protein